MLPYYPALHVLILPTNLQGIGFGPWGQILIGQFPTLAARVVVYSIRIVRWSEAGFESFGVPSGTEKSLMNTVNPSDLAGVLADYYEY